MACVGSGFDGNPAFEPGNDFPHDVGSINTCEGGYPGIFDMSGNIWEWEGSCSGSAPNDACLMRGGSYFENSETDLGCPSNVNPTRDTTALTIGFRCCADPN
jgi:formylglycine-generating enzyme required for sulfatase activity